jgi:hypothetical protein
VPSQPPPVWQLHIVHRAGSLKDGHCEFSSASSGVQVTCASPIAYCGCTSQ